MLIENFRERYSAIPLAIFARDHRKDSVKRDRITIAHMHKEIELLLVLEGEAEVHMDSSVYPIRKGSIVVIAPHTLHQYTLFADRDFSHYCLCFDPELLGDPQLRTDLENGNIRITGILEDSPECAQYIQNAYHACDKQLPGWNLTATGSLQLIFGAFLRMGYLQNSQSPAQRSVYRDIYQYITDHYREDITSSDAAASLGFHNSYFCRLFHKTYGDSFQNYVCSYRLEKARNLLLTKDLPISQVAAQVGFNSFSYFSKKFREYYHSTPSEYKKRS